MSRLLPFLCVLILLAGCVPAGALPVGSTPAPATLATAAPASPSPTLPAPATVTPAPPTPAAPVPPVCSPLDGIDRAGLAALVSNPYHPPRAGSDDPHHGVDLADTRNPNAIALSGRGVRAALAGTVAAVITDRFPYGNALIIETPLDALPPELAAALALPAAAPTITPPALTCPPFDPARAGDGARRSFYLLYAHMQDAPTVQVGDVVACGQPVGAIGQSGNALNPHLHIEARVGPAGARPGSLAHYTDSAALDEMAAYCAWRVSGLFATFDPLPLLLAAP